MHFINLFLVPLKLVLQATHLGSWKQPTDHLLVSCPDFEFPTVLFTVLLSILKMLKGRLNVQQVAMDCLEDTAAPIQVRRIRFN